jgi:hypothetical protein
MSSDWQDDVELLASLGKPLGEFVINGRVLVLRLALAFGFFLAGIGLIVLLVMAKGHHVHILIWGPLMALMGLTLAIRSYRNLGLRVLIFPEGGIRFHHDQVSTFFWEEIARLRRKKIEEHWSSAWQGSLILILEKTNGETIQFDDALPRLGELANMIQSRTHPVLLSSTLSALERNETVEFGELLVSPFGLKLKKARLAWDEIKGMDCDNQTLVIYQKNKGKKWCTLKVSEVPNHHIIPALVEQVVKSRSQEVRESL